jgi:hypothetical protein
MCTAAAAYEHRGARFSRFSCLRLCRSLAKAVNLASCTLEVGAMHSSLLSLSPKRLRPVVLPSLSHLRLTFHPQAAAPTGAGSSRASSSPPASDDIWEHAPASSTSPGPVKPHHIAAFIARMETPALKTAAFSVLPGADSAAPGEWHLPLRHVTARGDPRWLAAAKLFSSCTVVVEDEPRDLNAEALSRAKELLPMFTLTGGLAMWLGQKVTPAGLSRLLAIWPAPDVVMRGYQHLPALLRLCLRNRTPLALSAGYIDAMKLPPAPQNSSGASDSAGSTAATSSGNADRDAAAEQGAFRRFQTLDIYNCDLLNDESFVSAASLCERGGHLQFHGTGRATDALFEQLTSGDGQLGSVMFWGASTTALTVAGGLSLLKSGAVGRVFLQQGCHPGKWIGGE